MTIIQLNHVSAILEAGAHFHEARHHAEIAAHWQGKILANPSLYNGDTVLGSSWSVSGDRARIISRRIKYSTLVHWLKTPARPGAKKRGANHFFATGAILGSDGKIVMGRMAEHTLNSGRIYMPSGSMEIADFSDGAADFDANMHREVREETGLDLAEAAAMPGLQAYIGGGLFAIFRCFQFGIPAALLAARASEFAHAQEGGELAEILVVSPGETLAQMPVHTRAFMQWLGKQSLGPH